MNRAELQQLSIMREAEALALLDAGHYHGAYYLIGYAVECALKACIAKEVKEFDFPDRDLAVRVFTHNIEQLIYTSSLKDDFDKERKASTQFSLYWTTVKDWRETSRYRVDITEQAANDLFNACRDAQVGILRWVRERW